MRVSTGWTLLLLQACTLGTIQCGTDPNANCVEGEPLECDQSLYLTGDLTGPHGTFHVTGNSSSLVATWDRPGELPGEGRWLATLRKHSDRNEVAHRLQFHGSATTATSDANYGCWPQHAGETSCRMHYELVLHPVAGNAVMTGTVKMVRETTTLWFYSGVEMVWSQGLSLDRTTPVPYPAPCGVCHHASSCWFFCNSSSSSSSGGFSSSSSSSSSGGGGCGRHPGTRPVNTQCSVTPECICGTDCVAGVCRVRCAGDTPGECDEGAACVRNSAGRFECAAPLSVDQDCSVTPCAGGARCDAVVSEPSLWQGASVCHLPCASDATCAAGSACLPSTPGAMSAQWAADGGVVACGDDGGDACLQDAGYVCADAWGARSCVATPTACGTPVALWDVSSSEDAGVGAITGGTQYCNHGPPIPDAGLLGSRFCSPITGVTRPPWVICADLSAGANPPGLGRCVAICRAQAEDGSNVLMDCPAGSDCVDSPLTQGPSAVYGWCQPRAAAGSSSSGGSGSSG